jgi:hypothetical protein
MHTGTKTMIEIQRTAASGRAKPFLRLFFVGLSLCLWLTSPTARFESMAAWTPDLPSFTSWPMGMVTGVSEGRIEIDYKPYPVHLELKIMDFEGVQKEVKDLSRGLPVRYRLKGQQVDYVVIVLAP